MKLILIPLIVLITIALSVQMINLQNPQTTFIGQTGIDTGLTTFGLNSVTLSVTLISGFVGLFAGLVVLGVLIGADVEILGSTIKLSERSQKIAFNSLFYGGIWGLFSVLAIVGVNGLSLFSIPIFGAVMYMLLSLVYAVGINGEINKWQN